MRRLALFHICLILFLPSALNAAEVRVKKLEKRKWTLTESTNFRVLSDAKPKHVLRIVQQLERYRAFSSMLLGLDKQPSGNSSFMVVTKNRSVWKAFGLPKDLVSVTLVSEAGRSTIFADVEDFSGASVRTSSVGRATIYSALSNQLFYEIGLQERTPFWYHMAFSQYLAGYTELDTQFRIGELEAMGRRLGFLFNRYGRLKPLDLVPVMSRKSYAVGLGGSEISNTAKQNFLAQAYLIFHYLYSDADRKSQLDDYILLINSGLPVEESIVEAFGVNAQKLSKSIANYAESDVTILSHDRSEIEEVLSFPSSVDYRQTKLSVGEFWREAYPQIVSIPESVISFREKKALREQVEAHLPKINSFMNELTP